MATVCHTDEETRGSTSSLPTQIVGNFMKDKVKNGDIRKQTGLRKLENIIKERRLVGTYHTN